MLLLSIDKKTILHIIFLLTELALQFTKLNFNRPDTVNVRNPDFGVFENRPVAKRSRFQTVSDNRRLLSGYRTFGSII